MSELLELTEKTLADKLAENIVAIDLQGVNPFADYYVIATARNLRHAAALAHDLGETAEKNGYPVRVQEGEDGSSWILLDLYEVVVHIFTDEARSIYKLEKLWGDLPITRYIEEKQA